MVLVISLIIHRVMMPDIRKLRNELHPSNTDRGDGRYFWTDLNSRMLIAFTAISALVIAIQMISSFCKKLQYQRRIIMVTNGRGSMDADDVEQIVGKLKEDNIELVIL